MPGVFGRVVSTMGFKQKVGGWIPAGATSCVIFSRFFHYVILPGYKRNCPYGPQRVNDNGHHTQILSLYTYYSYSIQKISHY